MSNLKITDKEISFFKEHDFSGISGYTEEEKKKILTDFLTKCLTKLYMTRTEKNLRLTRLPNDAEEFSSTEDKILQILGSNLRKAIMYLGYTEGNFKYAKYILCEEAKTSDGENVYIYCQIPEENQLGKVIASVSAQIVDLAETNTSWESNLSKMMKRHGYKLRTPNKRKYLFGKGHISAPRELKVQIKKDINVIFEIMQRSKAKAAEHEYVTDISDKVKDLTYFDFIRI